MKVKELIKKLEKCNPDENVIIKFGLDEEDEIGYPLEIAFVEDILGDCIIYGEYKVTKEDCNFIGQIDLKEAYQKMKEEEDQQ